MARISEIDGVNCNRCARINGESCHLSKLRKNYPSWRYYHDFCAQFVQQVTGKTLLNFIEEYKETALKRQTVPNGLTHQPQMTLRDYYAGQALAGFRVVPGESANGYARDAYAMADAMLQERERKA